MALAYEGHRAGPPAPSPARSKSDRKPHPGRAQSSPNTISASQARAARRREAMSNEQAVSAWLRELSGRGR